jgi:hypothetical protein
MLSLLRSSAAQKIANAAFVSPYHVLRHRERATGSSMWTSQRAAGGVVLVPSLERLEIQKSVTDFLEFAARKGVSAG